MAPGEPGVCGTTYTVEAGDTTFGIADKCGVDPQAIIDANPDIDAGEPEHRATYCAATRAHRRPRADTTPAGRPAPRLRRFSLRARYASL